MSRFIESIKLLEGKFYRLESHQERINKIFDEFFPEKEKITLSKIIDSQKIPQKGLFKFRVVFSSKTETVEIIPYTLPEIKSLKIIETDIPTTFYKSADREKINQAFSKKEDCDDILIVRNNLITDTSYCNIALFDGKNWFTPKTPLIYGTQRTSLLQKNKIIEKNITINDLSNYQSVCLFNAMIEFGEIIIPAKNIKR